MGKAAGEVALLPPQGSGSSPAPGKIFCIKIMYFCVSGKKNCCSTNYWGQEISPRPLTRNIGGQLTLLTRRSAAIACDYGSPVLQEIIGSAQGEFEGLLKIEVIYPDADMESTSFA